MRVFDTKEFSSRSYIKLKQNMCVNKNKYYHPLLYSRFIIGLSVNLILLIDFQLNP